MKDATPLPKKDRNESPELLVMRSFAALRHKVTRKDAIAAARWMVRYAMDYSTEYANSVTRRGGKKYRDD